MENKKRKTTGLLLSILGVLSLVLITAGVTYAFFNYAKEGQTVNTIRTGTITFAYTETDGNGKGINISNAMPTSDSDGMGIEDNSGEYGKVFRFTIDSRTPSSAKIPYVITLRKTDGILGDNQVKVYLAEPTGATVTTATELAAEGSATGASPVANYTYVSGAVKTFAQLPALNTNTITASVTPPAGTTERIMYAGVVPKNQSATYTHSFVLRMWLNGDEGSNQIADYSPFEFVRIAAETGNNASVVDAEALIGTGDFITSTAYYKLPATAQAAVAAHCELNGVTTDPAVEESNCTGEGYAWIPAVEASRGRDEYERIAYVDKTNRKVITISQAVTAGNATADANGNYTFNATSGTCDDSNYTDKFTCTSNSHTWTPSAANEVLTIGTATYDVTEQYYRINGATFQAIVNVYADGKVVETVNP